MTDAIHEVSMKTVPKRLREIPQPPKRLYARGTWPRSDTKMLAVVGARAVTPYGRKTCEALLSSLSGYPISIVSGLSLGVETEAHKVALAAGLHTTAVLGSSLEEASLYPPSNVGLAHEILQRGGLLVSEHNAGYTQEPRDVLARNRLIVGLADAVLLIEAEERSGTLVSARLASEYNRDLLCIPHRIGDPHGSANHLFIRLGATLVSEPLHILEALGIPPNSIVRERTLLFEGQERILYDLLATPTTRDDLIRSSKIPPGEARTALVTLELKGVITEEYGLWKRT